MRLWLMALLITVAAAPAEGALARADGPIATASAAQVDAPQASTPVPPLQDDDDAAVARRPDFVPGPCGPTRLKPDGSIDKSAHGEVEAGIGTGGYRHIAGSVCKPIGDDGMVAVSVGETKADWRGPR